MGAGDALSQARSRESNKRRAFHNDALIALTARRHGATLVTGNQEDFALLARALRIRVVYARP